MQYFAEYLPPCFVILAISLLRCDNNSVHQFHPLIAWLMHQASVLRDMLKFVGDALHNNCLVWITFSESVKTCD